MLGDHTAIIAVLTAARAVLGLNRLIARDRYPLHRLLAQRSAGTTVAGGPLRLADRSGPYGPVLPPGRGRRRRSDGPHPAVDVGTIPSGSPAVDRATGVRLCLQRAAGSADILPWLWSYGGRLVNADFQESMIARPGIAGGAPVAARPHLCPSKSHRRRQICSGQELRAPGSSCSWGSWGCTKTGWYGRIRYAVAEPPAGPQQAATSLDWAVAYESPAVFSLIRDSGDPDGAWSFLRWWTSRNIQREFQAQTECHCIR